MPAPKPATLPRFAQLQAWAATTYYAVLDRVINGGNLYECTTAGISAGAGGPAGVGAGIVDGTAVWQFISASSAPWVALTAYALGDRVTNGGNLYLCIIAGTSAGAGGPTTTGSDITDGTAHWMYLSAGTALVVVPSAGQKDVGWTAGQKPPAQFFNWFFYSLYTWILYLSDLAAQAWTWTGLHIFTKGIIVTQSTVNGTGVDGTGNGDGPGGTFHGGSGDSDGVQGYAHGAGKGGTFFGAGGGSSAVAAVGGAGDQGVYAQSGAGASAVRAVAGGGNAYGVEATGSGNNAGVRGAPGVNQPAPGISGVSANNASSQAVLARGTTLGHGVDTMGGNVAGVALIARPNGADATAIAQFPDLGGNLHHLVDHLGYLAGRITRWYEGWRIGESLAATAASARYLDFTATIVGTGVARRVDPATNGDHGCSTFEVQNDGLANGDLTSWVSERIFSPQSFHSIVLTFDVASVVHGAAVNAKLYCGVTADAGGDPTAANGAFVEATPGTWSLRVRSTAGGDSGALGGVGETTGGAPLTYTRMRIEIHGSASSFGTMVRWYSNGSITATTHVNIPDGSMRFVLACKRGAGAGVGAMQLRVTPVEILINRRQSSDMT